MSTYHAADAALEKAYWEAVGWCLQYRIPVHVKGRMKALGTLRDEIREHEKSLEVDGPKGWYCCPQCGALAATHVVSRVCVRCGRSGEPQWYEAHDWAVMLSTWIP